MTPPQKAAAVIGGKQRAAVARQQVVHRAGPTGAAPC